MFRWDDSSNELVPQCEVYDEYIIERYVGGWLKIREEVLKNKKVCFALEEARSFYHTSSGYQNHHLKAPIHRIMDFADIVIVRHDVADAPKQRVAYAEWTKAGKYVIVTPKAWDWGWNWYKSQAEQTLMANANGGIYSWNELNPTDYKVALIKNIQETNNVKRYFNWVDQKNKSLLKNSNVENGANCYLPDWVAQPLSLFSHNSARAYSGKASMKIKGSKYTTVLKNAEEISFSNDKNYGVLFWTRVEGNINIDQNIQIDITIGNSEIRTITYTKKGWSSETDTKRIKECSLQYDVTKLADISTEDIKENNRWISFIEVFENILGNHKIEFTMNIPENVTLYLDKISLIELK